MDGMGKGYLQWKTLLCNYCFRHCVRVESIQNYFHIFSFSLIWDKNLGSHTDGPVAKPL